MPNPLYNMLMGGARPQQGPMNPIQKVNSLFQAMRNPQQFVRQAFPDIPNEIMGDPNQILQYLQQTRNISNEQIQNLMNQFPHF